MSKLKIVLKYYYATVDREYTLPNRRKKDIWVVKNPHGRAIAETIGKGTAIKIVNALNEQLENNKED